MSTPSNPGASVNTVGFGNAPLSSLGCIPIVSTVAPSSSNVHGPYGKYAIGQTWIDTVTNAAYILTSYSASNGSITANWTIDAGGSSLLSTLTGGSGGAISPTSGNINLLGTTNQITTTGSGSTITWSIPTTFIAPGSIAATTTLTATLGNITATNGNLNLATTGNKILIHATTAASDSIGTATLAGAATTTVSTTAVTAASKIFLQTRVLGTVSAASTLAVTAVSPGVNFTITPSQSTDTSTVDYWIIN
jgi:hypothetical protein